MTREEELFVQQLLEDRDEFYRENYRLREQLSGFDDFAAEKASLEEQLRKKDQIISQQEQRISILLRKIWGKSSERFISEDPQQRKLDFDGLDLLEEEQQLTISAIEEIEQYKEKEPVQKPKKKAVRKPLPESLPREEYHIYPKNIDLTKCTELAPEITEVLERDPARWYVRQIIRHKYVVKTESTSSDNTTTDDTTSVNQTIVTAPMPLLPIPKSYAGATVLADMMINKYVNHLPFYRQIEMFKQQGISLPASTVNDWFAGVADLMRPAWHRIMELVLKSDYIQADETTVPIVNNEKHKTVKGYLWMVRAVMPGLVFFYYDQGSRAQKVALKLFKEYQGALQSDGYAVYDIYENKKGVLPLGCWAHVRRKFEEALSEDKSRAEYALEQIGLLYDVERQADQENLSDEQRAELRTRLSYPIMVAFEKWLVREYPMVLPKGRIGKAIRYTYNIYNKLTRYHLDGRWKMDNNLAENEIRPIALGRKNWLFCKNHDAAENAAIVYSLLGCCKASGVNFREWLVYFLENVHHYDNDYSKDLAELLPHNFASKKSE
jgi:transposase